MSMFTNEDIFKSPGVMRAVNKAMALAADLTASPETVGEKVLAALLLAEACLKIGQSAAGGEKPPEVEKLIKSLGYVADSFKRALMTIEAEAKAARQ